ncbi:cytochrome c-type heme lyase subunit nrfE [Vibrio sp. JCM 19236]|nr:cytochrome c-type heme lyase subunit nrfE [Vibrio sp. JCM 19236]
MYAFAIDDFSLSYVSDNSNSALAMGFKLAATWVGIKAQCCSGYGYSRCGVLDKCKASKYQTCSDHCNDGGDCHL